MTAPSCCGRHRPPLRRIWDAHVVDALVERFGDGISGYWRVPGEFGRRVDVDKAYTTLYASKSGARGRHAGGPPACGVGGLAIEHAARHA